MEVFKRLDKIGELTLETFEAIYPMGLMRVRVTGVFQILVVIILMGIWILLYRRFRQESNELYQIRKEIHSSIGVDSVNTSELSYGDISNLHCAVDNVEEQMEYVLCSLVFILPISIGFLYFGLLNLFASHWRALRLILQTIK